MSKIDKSAKFLNKMDYVISAGFIIAGAIFSNWWFVASGILGITIAIWNPTNKVLAYIAKKFGAKKSKNSSISKEELEAKNQVYSQLNDSVESTANQFLDIEVETPKPSPFSVRLVNANVFLKPSKFNIYTPENIKTSINPNINNFFS